MLTELASAVGGLAIGAVVSPKITTTCIEAVSTPLLNTPLAPPAPTKENYLAIIDFPGNINKFDFLYSHLVSDASNNIYSVWLSYIPATSGMNIRVRKVYPTYQVIVDTTYAATTATDTEFKVTSEAGTITVNYSDWSVISSINVPSIPLTINLIHTPGPFIFNYGNTATISPGKYVFGLENAGNVTGNINGTTVTGFGINERISWNFDEFGIKGYRWIPFSTSDGIVKGIVCRVGLYYDGCFYYNNTYYPLNYIDISTQTYEGTVKKTQFVIAVSGNTVLFLQLTSFYDELGIRNFGTISAMINTTPVGTGFYWEDSSVL